MVVVVHVPQWTDPSSVSKSLESLSVFLPLSLKALLLLLSLSNLATQSPSLSHSCRTHARGREGES